MKIIASLKIVILFSLTTDINRASKNPPVPTAQIDTYNVPGVRVYYFFASASLSLSSIPFRLQTMATLKEGDQLQMWEFIQVS